MPLKDIKFSDDPIPHVLMISAFLAIFAWVTPNHEPPLPAFHGELSMALAALVLGAWVLWRTRAQPAVAPLIAVMVLGAAVIPWLQLAAGRIDFLGVAVLASTYLVGFGLIITVGYRAAVHWDADRVLKILAGVILVGALLSMWLALYQWQGLYYLTWYSSGAGGIARATANLNQPNHLATLLVMGVLSTAVLLDRGSIGRATALLLVALFGFGIAMTQSRVGLLELAIVVGLFILKRRRLGAGLRLRDILVGALVVFLMPTVWSFVLGAGGESIRDAAAAAKSSSVRLIHWQEMAAAIRLQPWFGWGWSGAPIAQYAVRLDFPATYEVLGHSHNLFIDLLVWNGIPLGVGLSLGLLAWFWLVWRRAADSTAMLSLGIVTAVGVHAMVEYPLHYTYYLLPVGLLMGAASRSALRDATWRLPNIGAGALWVLAMAIVLMVTIDYRRLDEDMRAHRMQVARIGLNQQHVYSEPLVLWQLHAALNFLRMPERKGISEDEVDEMQRVVRRYPSQGIVMRYAAAMTLNGRPEEAREALRQACKLGDCERAKAIWKEFGRKYPEAAALDWPE
jgi:O-antigen ligase